MSPCYTGVALPNEENTNPLADRIADIITRKVPLKVYNSNYGVWYGYACQVCNLFDSSLGETWIPKNNRKYLTVIVLHINKERILKTFFTFILQKSISENKSVNK